MSDLFMQLATNGEDYANAIPQALIAATVAAKNAEGMAWQVWILGIIILSLMLVGGGILIYIMLQFRDLVIHTNGMRESLVAATRKLALLEGNVTGRQELEDEQAGLKKEKKDGN